MDGNKLKTVVCYNIPAPAEMLSFRMVFDIAFKDSSLTITVTSGSYAGQYAKENNISYTYATCDTE